MSVVKRMKKLLGEDLFSNMPGGVPVSRGFTLPARPSEELIRQAVQDAKEVGLEPSTIRLKLVPIRLVRPREVGLTPGDDLVQAYEENKPVAPVVVQKMGPMYLIVDGNHRYEAALNSGCDKIWVVIGEEL